MVSTAAEVLSRKLEDLSIGDSGSPGSESLEATENDFFCSLSRSVMVEVASWIKATVQAVLEKTVVNVNTGWAPGPADSVNSIAATDKLALAVKVLEIFDDVRTMSQVRFSSVVYENKFFTNRCRLSLLQVVRATKECYVSQQNSPSPILSHFLPSVKAPSV